MKSLRPADRAAFTLGAGAAAAMVAGGAKAHPIIIALAGIACAYITHLALKKLREESPEAEQLIELLATFL